MKQRGFFARVIVWWVLAVLLAAVVEIPPVQAVAPWSVDAWESVRSYKQRLNQTQYRQPRHLPLHQCKYLDPDECRRQDEYQEGIVAERQRLSVIDNNDATVLDDATRRILQRRRRVLEAPRRGNIKVLVLLIRFADHKNRALPSRTYFDALFNGDAPNSAVKVNAVGSIKEWMRYNSMGRYKGTKERSWRRIYVCARALCPTIGETRIGMYTHVLIHTHFVVALYSHV
jgi:hypothetical protein